MTKEKKDLIKEMTNYARNNPTGFNQYDYDLLNDVELMREISKKDGVYSLIMYYMGEDVQNDLEFHLNLLKHAKLNEREYVFENDYLDEFGINLNISDFSNSYIGLDVRSERIFWETLNNILLQNGFKYPFYDVEKEIKIALLEKEELKKLSKIKRGEIK